MLGLVRTMRGPGRGRGGRFRVSVERFASIMCDFYFKDMPMLDFLKKKPASRSAELPESLRGEGTLYAVFRTSLGTMVAELYEKEAPETVANFVGLATGHREWIDPKTREKTTRPLYDGTIFHRVIPRFMIQGGDPLGRGTGGPGYRFKDEFHPRRRHDRPGILSMANSGPNTNGSQFFITEVPTPHLDDRHSVFGCVVKGVDVVTTIADTPRDASDRPHTPVVLESLTIVRSKDVPSV